MELRQAVLDGDVAKARALLQFNPSINPNYSSPTDECAALHFAAAFGNIEIITVLLQHPDIRIDIQNLEGNTPLHVAVARSLKDVVMILLQFGANPFIRNFKEKRPLDYCSNNEIRAYLTREMSSAPDMEEKIVTPEEKRLFEESLPQSYDALKAYFMEFMVKHVQFQEKVREALLRLIEDKHVALHKYRLFEQAAGLVGAEQSENFMNQLAYLQQENEKQTADLVYYKNTANMLKTAAQQQEDAYQKELADITAEHNEQLQAMISRAEESERIFMEFQKKNTKEMEEISRLRTENATLKTKLSILEQGDHSRGDDQLLTGLQNEISSLSLKFQEVSSQNIALQEKLKSFGQLKAIRETENSSPIPPQVRHSIQEELVSMEEIRKKQDEQDELSGKLVFIKGEGDGPRQVKGGTIEKLVERLTDGVSYDSQFQQAFLLTFRAFMKPDVLLNLMIQRYDSATDDVNHPGLSQPIRLRVCNTLKYWIDNFWFDFEDVALYDKAYDFITNKVVKDTPKMTEQLVRLFERKRRGSDVVTIQRKEINQPKPLLPRVMMRKGSAVEIKGTDTLVRDQRGVSLLGIDRFYNMVSSRLGGDNSDETPAIKFADLDPLEIARQLTLLEYDLFKSVKPNEFLDQAWLKEDKMKQAPGICEMTNWSTRITKWIISEIVSIQDSVRARAIIFEKFIMVAQHMEKLNNFNGVMEILAAFQSSAVHRLKKTTQAVGSRYLKILDELMKLTSRELNYKNLRSKVHAANPPLIPFPGVYLGDLVFLDTGNLMYLSNDKTMINFQKFQKLASYILELQVYQQTPYNFAAVMEIQQYLREVQFIGDDAAYNMSLICEPRQTIGRGTSTFLNVKN